MNVMEALESLTTAMELMQEDRKRQDAKIERLVKRANSHEMVGLAVAFIVLMAVIFFS